MEDIERKRLRFALAGFGFTRTRYTDDIDASGVYNETWERPNADPAEVADTLTIEWGKRGPVPLIEVLADLADGRCPYLCTDELVTRGGTREDGWRCGQARDHGGSHILYDAEGERIIGTRWGAWKKPEQVR